MDINNLPKIEISSAKDFFELLPEKIKKEWLIEIETNFHFNISGENGGEFSVEVREGELFIYDDLYGEAKCVIQSKDIHFIKLLNGQMNPVMAILTGKLKVSNQEEIMKHARILGLL